MAVNLVFQLNGNKTLVPVNWQDTKENYQFGRISSQPQITNESFEFVGESAVELYKRFQNGEILKGVDVSQRYTQGNITTDVFNNYIVDMTEGVRFEDVYNNSPLKAFAKVRKKDNVTTFFNELQGLTFGYLKDAGFISSSDYTDVKTAIVPLFDVAQIGITILSIFVIRREIQRVVEETKIFLADSIARLAGLDPAQKVANIVYIALVTVLTAASLTIQILLLTKLVNDLLRLFLPKIITHKGMTWRSLVTSVLRVFNYDLECSFPELDQEVILPSNPHSNETDVIKSLLPSYPEIKEGYPNSNDEIYNCEVFFNALIDRFNANLRIDNRVLKIVSNRDFKEVSNFKPRIEQIVNQEPNIKEIPQTTIYSFRTDTKDDYTLENLKGLKYEVKNLSKHIRLKGLQRFDLPFALGVSKTKLSIIETLMITLAKVSDTLTGGGAEKKIRRNRTNILKVSSPNHSVAKLVPIINGNMPSNHREITSARKVESYHIDRSIVRGTGQKLITDILLPFNLKDREEILNNGQFSYNGLSRFRELEYTFSTDLIEGKIETDFNYIAEGDIEEVLIEPE